MGDSSRAAEWTTGALTLGWTLTQQRRGHRHSTDDLLTGFYAALCFPKPKRILDLGAGIGSVGLLALWRSPRASLTAVEAQDVSYELLEHNIAANGLGPRARAVHGDLRLVRFPGESFDLVTASPPYFDPRAGIVPSDSQKAHARFELRGDIRDYAIAARDALDPSGGFVFCFPTSDRSRAEAAVVAAGLCLLRSRDVVPREGLRPLFTLFACALGGREAQAPWVEPPYVVRDRDGNPTALHQETRAAFGFGEGKTLL